VKKPHKLQNGAALNVEGNHPSTVSARKLESNRENSKKSTGPKTARGKANSRFNAVKHGLCAKRLIFSSQGKLLDADLLKLLESLQAQYGSDDVRVQLLCDAIVTEYWRQGQSLRFEMKFLSEGDIHFGSQGGMSGLQRYLTSSQRALLKNLELLHEIQPQLPPAKQPAVATVAESDPAAGGRRRALKIVGQNGLTHTPTPKSTTRDAGPAEPAQNSEPSASEDTKELA
jgi:hypothetical protein